MIPLPLDPSILATSLTGTVTLDDAACLMEEERLRWVGEWREPKLEEWSEEGDDPFWEE